ncbi:hypothetical protein COW36_01425 [bacterium (Candidatus Blackallbacteria) CG17_big_fil_post_rev_8_21_14_2_50_48_46]|uniref:Nudix hydrolase domain-containing protein n=1 Tax=bacterium (Candidatus Blackallbacteria) CG17_big_fil_post_rev_8_21_14_2_50_48_46 TaxID=2014261 RepID=A0A2M7GBH7_9BACT|nr:MAG: hypothetical protein COW64_09750 [bacterium (Candidatus Blackallbacteria) CG18_big_fil_WC_8_21_14_2_50_49_26]PIW19528.1 MAG: hypothetical protein COW36_01425 [bacterium (Candidatus Blackallbacteria) CG17_big_fil_post_rev_8_21_14_2_50_48_46]PIW48868.1 MAG: hypothetical protein COW20_07030 [bacterium (Candidatus Blackallbacteria) CG13_big_fil_rev_8_21_14_2_50_49_14]
MKPPQNWLQVLDEIRALAQMGLNYADGSPYDRARYERLLELSARSYAELSELPTEIVMARFQKEVGHITPKVGVNGALFNASGQILLVKRRDDGCWSLPAGWCDMNESPYEALEREWREELGLTITAGSVLEIFTRKPGDYGSPHTSYLLLMACYLRGPLKVQLQEEELLDWGWFEIDSPLNWHLDHPEFARLAHQDWLKRTPSDAGAESNGPAQ